MVDPDLLPRVNCMLKSGFNVVVLPKFLEYVNTEQINRFYISVQG